MASFATIAVETLAGGATAFRAASLSTSAAFQHQKLTHTERGNSWGLCAPIPAVVYDNVRDWSAIGRAGFMGADAPNLLINWRGLNCAPSLSRNSHRVAFPSLAQSRRPVGCSSRSIGHQLRARAVIGCASPFHSVRVAACKRVHAHILPVEQVYQGITHRDHVSNLSSSLVSVGIDPNERRLTNAQRSFAPGAKAND